MVLKIRHKSEIGTILFLENSRAPAFELPQDNPLRRISLTFQIDVNTPSGDTPATGFIQNGLLKFIKKMVVLMDGVDNKFAVSALTYYHASKFQNATKPFSTAETAGTVAADSTVSSFFSFTIDFAQNKNDLNDMSGLLNAPALSSLDLIVDWGAITNLYSAVQDTVILPSTKCSISVDEVYDDGTGDNELDSAIINAVDFRETEDAFFVTKLNDSFGTSEQEEKMLPVPSTILQQMLLTETNITTPASTILSNAVVSDLKIQNVRGGQDLIFIDKWNDLQRQQKADYALEKGDNDDGLVFINWAELRFGGLLNNVVDAIKFKFLTLAPAASTENRILLYNKHIVASTPT